MPKVPKNTPPPLPISPLPIGSRIAAFRKTRGFSQESLAEAMGISRKQVSDYETGKAHLNDEMIVRFTLALGSSADVLLGLKEIDYDEDKPGLRLTRRMRELDSLPEQKKKAILKTLDDLIRANS